MQDAGAKGYSLTIFDQKNSGSFEMDSDNMLTLGMACFTHSLVRLGPKDTEAKLRADNVYCHELLAEDYKLIWGAVDEQMLLDNAPD